jgi:SAM-dependent methyltransferase
MGIDARHRKYLKERLQVSSLPTVQMERGDVCQTKFADGSFDVVVGRSVMHHIPDPSVALSEIARILRPNGVAIANLHLYTSHNGSLDARVISGDYDASLLWAHLRSATAKGFEGNSFLNKLRLDQWRTVLSGAWPGCTIETEVSSRPGIRESADALISTGAIAGYSLEELTTHTVTVYWRKPSSYESAS